MATANVQIKKILVGRGNATVTSAYPGVRGEVTMNTTTKTLHVHDGVTTGGWPLATEFYVANLLAEYGGVPGPQGPQGNIGAQGPTGATGSQGPQGIQGNTGAQGIQGNVGATGAQGIQGNVGATGATGPQGIQGNTGATGSQGIQGNTGATGATGAQGIQGNVGATGSQGPQGAAGAKGDQGIQGIQGNTGAQGVSVTLRGNVSSPAALPVPGTAGDGYIVDSTGNLWFWNSTITAWADIGKIVGPEGPRGPQGIQGNTGAQGIQGIQGNVGATGPQGIQGNTGATGPQGIQGIQGNTGATGPQGIQGNVGATGAQGPQGIQGNTGAQGPQGIQGNVGPQGIQGNVGSQGIQGNVGPQGPQGAAGSSANTGDFTFTHSNLATTTGANIRLTTNSNTFVLSSTGNLFLPNNMVFTSSPAVSGTGIVFGDGSYQYTAFTGTATAIVANLDNNGSQVRLDSGGTLSVPNRIAPIGTYGVAISPTNLSNTTLDWNFSAEGKVSKLYAPYSVSPVQSSIQFIGGTGNGQLGWDSGIGQTGLPYAESLFVASTGNLNVVGTNVHIRGGRTGIFDLGNQYQLGSGGYALGELSGFTFIGAQFTSYYFVQSTATDYFTTLLTNNLVIDAGSYQGSMAITPVTRTSFGMNTNNKYVFQIKVGRPSAIGNNIGVITESGDFTQGLGAANFDYSVGFESYGVYNGPPDYAAAPKFGVDDYVIVAVDRVNHKIWIKVLYNEGNDGESAWNSDPTADPTTNTGGFELPTFGGAAIYPAVTSVNGNNYADLGWTFGQDGNITLPGGNATIGHNAISGDTQTYGISGTANTYILIDSAGNDGSTAIAWASDYANIGTSGTAIAEVVTSADGISLLTIANTAAGVGPKSWNFGLDGTTQFPGDTIAPPMGSDISIETKVLFEPTTIVIGGADFVAVNLTYTRANGVTPPKWIPAGYNASSDPYILFDNDGWGIWVPGFNQSLYVTSGPINNPEVQWSTHPPLGSVPPTGTYSPVSYVNTWNFGANGVLRLPTNGNITFANGVNILSTVTGGGGSLGGFGAYYNALYTNNNDDMYLAPFWDSGPGAAYLKLPGDTNAGGNAVVLSNQLENGAGVSIVSSNPRNSNTEYTWNFAANGTLIIPGGIEFTSSTATIANVDTITVLDHIRSPAYQFANGVSILNGLATIVGNVGGDAALGALWFNTEDGRTYVRAGGYWVDANPPVSPAPSFYTGNLEFSGETITSDTKSWTFGTDGNLSLPPGVAFIATQFDPEYIGDYDNSVVVSNNGLSVEAVSVTPNTWLTTALLNTPILQGEKKMFSIYIDRMSNNRGGYNGIGIATHLSTLTTYIGDNAATGVGFYEQGSYYGNDRGYGAPEGFTTGDIIDVAVDNDGFNIWMRRNGGYWNNRSDADPATNAYGYETGEYGTVYPGVTPYFENADIGNKFTLQTIPTYGVPAGFEFYGAELYESAYIKFGNNSLTVDHTGNLLVNGNLVTGSGGSSGTGNTLVNGGYTVALEANGVLTLGSTATIRNDGEFKLWADNDITVYRNGQDGYGVKAGNIKTYTDNVLRTVTNSDGFELKTGNLVIPSKIVTSGNVLEIGSNGNPIGSVRINSTNNAWIFTNGNIAEEFGYFTIDSGYESGTPGLFVRGSEMVHRMMYSSGNIASAITLTQPNVPTVEYPPTVNISLYDDSSTPTATTWTFGGDGNISLPSNIAAINFANGTNILSTVSTGNITFSGSDISGTGSNVTLTADTTDYVFYANGTVRTDGALTIVVPGVPSSVANWSGGGGWNRGYSNLATTGGTGTGLTVDVSQGSGGYISAGYISINNPGTGYTDGDVITITNENSLGGTFTITVPAYNWTFSANGATIFSSNLILPQFKKILFGNASTHNYIHGEDDAVSLHGGLASSQITSSVHAATSFAGFSINDNVTGVGDGSASVRASLEGNAAVTIFTLDPTDLADIGYAWTFDDKGRTTFPATTVPVHSYGAAGDKAGMVIFDADYIYYCKSDFVGHTSSIVVDSDQWSNSVGAATSLPFLSTARAPETGWTISINFNSGVTTLTITGVTSLGAGRYQVDFNSVGSINVSNGNSGTLIDSTPAADIWVRTVWTDTNW